MLHARLFTTVPAYRAAHFDAHPSEQPVVAQLAGHDPAVVLEAARAVEEHAAVVDMNFGCPQAIARKGRYGAFLLDEHRVLVEPACGAAVALLRAERHRHLFSRHESVVLVVCGGSGVNWQIMEHGREDFGL